MAGCGTYIKTVVRCSYAGEYGIYPAYAYGTRNRTQILRIKPISCVSTVILEEGETPKLIEFFKTK